MLINRRDNEMVDLKVCICLILMIFANLLGQEKQESQERLHLNHADEAYSRSVGDKNIRVLEGNVLFTQGQWYWKCQICSDDPEQDIYTFEKNVEVYLNDKWLYADKVIYYHDKQMEEAQGHVRLIDSTKTLLANNLEYLEINEKAFATGDVRILDDTDSIVLSGEEAIYNRPEGYAKITGQPVFTKTDTTDSSKLIITGKIMEMFQDGDRLLVSDSVFVERGKVNAHCNELEYFQKEKKVTLSGSPKASRKWDNLWGDEIILKLDEKEVKTIEIIGKAVVTSKVDTLDENDERMNFIKGENMLVWLTEEKIDSVRVRGQATSYYHVIEDDEDKGINKVLGDELLLHLINSELKRVLVKSSPGTTNGTYFPPAQTSLVQAEINELIEKHHNNKQSFESSQTDN